MRNKNDSSLKGTHMKTQTTKQWKIGDRVTAIQGYHKGTPLTIKWVRTDETVSVNVGVTVVTDDGRTLSFHPNNLKFGNFNLTGQPANYVGDGPSGFDYYHDLRLFPCE